MAHLLVVDDEPAARSTLALLLRNLWQWLTYLTELERSRQQQQGVKRTALPRFKDVLHAFANALHHFDNRSPGPGVT